MEGRFDGSFFGLLTLLERWFELGVEATAITAGEAAQPGLFGTPFLVTTEPSRARAFLAEVAARHGAAVPHLVRDAFLAQTPQGPMLIYRYLARGRLLGRDLDRHLADPDVAALHGLVRRVRREAHRLKGLARFAELADGLLYASLRPDALVLPLLARHFRARFGSSPWLIHDLGRDLGLLCDGERWTLGALAVTTPPTPAAAEEDWQRLWRRFFREIAIVERRNPRLQQHFMPKKYWAELVEVGP